MHSKQPVGGHTQVCKVRKRSALPIGQVLRARRSCASYAGVDFSFCFMKVQVNLCVVLLRQFFHFGEGVIRDSVRGMGTDACINKGRLLHRGDELFGLLQVVGCVFSIRGRELNNRAANKSTDPSFVSSSSNCFWEKVHIIKSSRSRLEHLQYCETSSLDAEFVREVFSLCGPDVFTEPLVEGQIVAKSLHECHGSMSMTVD
mmetsp:Transcript_28868/g.74050  ORF Transcript_28868/g.74050 Transcript_28868/m.74050 type:complete len:202 (-) Transcript_28868:861-1466(-)